jgi:hypothetical protein
VHDKILELKAHFESKLSLIQRLNEEGWINLMCIKYIIKKTTTIGPHVCGS